jgi:hypothetical protein
MRPRPRRGLGWRKGGDHLFLKKDFSRVFFSIQPGSITASRVVKPPVKDEEVKKERT